MGLIQAWPGFLPCVELMGSLVQDDMKMFVDIYSSVINALKASQQRRFIVAEQNFFRLWWDNAMMSEKNEVLLFLGCVCVSHSRPMGTASPQSW